MGLGEAALPVRFGTDGGVGGGVEVSVAVVIVVAEEDRGVGAGAFVVEEIVGVREVLGSCAEVSAESGGGPGWEGLRHDDYIRSY